MLLEHALSGIPGRLLIFFMVLHRFLIAGVAERAIWAKGAIPIGNCYGISQGNPIPAPNGKVAVELRCHPAKKGNEPVPYLHVRTGSGHWHDVALDEGAHEVLWSSDSMAFLVNGGTTSYSGFFTAIYLLAHDAIRKFELTGSAQADMVRRFPPCRAWNRDEITCEAIVRNPQFNMSALAWVDGSSAVMVFAEVPCSSSYGGIMCQVEGYKLAVPSGSIQVRMTATELKANWQPSMAWAMRIPEPPVYGDAQKTR